MSDAPNPPIPPVPTPGAPPSTTKTSSVPLKKETVRITLRSKPGDTPDAAPVAPPTTPLRPAAPPPPVGRPAPPPAPIGSKTIPLTQAPAPRTPGAPSAAMRSPTTTLGGAAPTQPMPKPTVRLQPAQASGPVTSAVASAPVKTGMVDDEEEAAAEMPLNIMAIVGLVLAVAVFLIALFSFDQFTFGVDTMSSAPWKLPKPETMLAKPLTNADGSFGGYKTTLELKNIPTYDGTPAK